jgi:hypothetical protein
VVLGPIYFNDSFVGPRSHHKKEKEIKDSCYLTSVSPFLISRPHSKIKVNKKETAESYKRKGTDVNEEVVTPLMLDGTYLSRNFATLGPLT